jgi:hypothetical protein
MYSLDIRKLATHVYVFISKENCNYPKSKPFLAPGRVILHAVSQLVVFEGVLTTGGTTREVAFVKGEPLVDRL